MNSTQKSKNRDKRGVIVSLLKEILFNSLAQAILKIALTPYVVLKAILIFVLASIGFVSYLIMQTMLAFLEYNVSTTSRTIYKMPTLFPKVTFCNLNDSTTEYAYNLTQSNIYDGEFLSAYERKMIVHNLDDILI
jgi:hypothetical protein